MIGKDIFWDTIRNEKKFLQIPSEPIGMESLKGPPPIDI
jgi:hypothetical protein